ncbi:MAG: DUF4886 domain-containing protein [Tannerellaceae bacterium]|jgi:hypothetical protein|nr:DUF4886 domain-containing protein [Tannerellaceae bacterium]
MRKLLTIVVLSFSLLSVYAQESIKILAIGNSFSEDAVEQYLYELGAATGDSLVIGNAYIGGCSLETHWNNAVANKKAYKFRKIIGGTKTEYAYTLLDCIINEDWDYITFQQVSTMSGIADSYFPYITHLLKYVKENALNESVQFVLHRTWAYAGSSEHPGFANYGKNQLTMYKQIVEATNKVAGAVSISLIIPSGTAIQNGRTSHIGDNFCRDGYHLSNGLGRFTAACTWYGFFTGKDVTENPYTPATIPLPEAEVAKNAARCAILHPDEIALRIEN